MILLCNMDELTYRISGKSDLLSPVTPYDPRLTYDPIVYVEGLELMHMYVSNLGTCYVTWTCYIAFFVKMTF